MTPRRSAMTRVRSPSVLDGAASIRPNVGLMAPAPVIIRGVPDKSRPQTQTVPGLRPRKHPVADVSAINRLSRTPSADSSLLAKSP